jgi:signal transduction histidine kinase
MESGRFEILKSPFDFASIVAEVIESSQPQLEAMGQSVDFQISVDVLLVNGDRERLFQVITNLLSNASKYSPNDSKIEIEVEEDQRWLRLGIAGGCAGRRSRGAVRNVWPC